MENDRNKVLIESIKRLIRRNAVHHLRKIANKTHAADLSVAFRSLSISHQKIIFDLIDDVEQQGILLSELDEDTFQDLIEGMDMDTLVEIFEQMPNDDVVDLISLMPESTADTLLARMKKEGSNEVEKLLLYDDDTAGGIMVPDFIALKEDVTAKQAIEAIQTEFVDVEMPFYLYVVDEYGKLVGVSSLRQLVVIPPAPP